MNTLHKLYETANRIALLPLRARESEIQRQAAALSLELYAYDFDEIVEAIETEIADL